MHGTCVFSRIDIMLIYKTKLLPVLLKTDVAYITKNCKVSCCDTQITPLPWPSLKVLISETIYNGLYGNTEKNVSQIVKFPILNLNSEFQKTA